MSLRVKTDSEKGFLHRFFAIVSIKYDKVFVNANFVGLFPQDIDSEGVESAYKRPQVAWEIPIYPLTHFRSRFVGEGDSQDF